MKRAMKVTREEREQRVLAAARVYVRYAKRQIRSGAFDESMPEEAELIAAVEALPRARRNNSDGREVFLCSELCLAAHRKQHEV